MPRLRGGMDRSRDEDGDGRLGDLRLSDFGEHYGAKKVHSTAIDEELLPDLKKVKLGSISGSEPLPATMGGTTPTSERRGKFMGSSKREAKVPKPEGKKAHKGKKIGSSRPILAFPRGRVNSFRTAHTDQPTYNRASFEAQLTKVRDKLDVFGVEKLEKSAALVQHHEVRFPNDGSYAFCVQRVIECLHSKRVESTPGPFRVHILGAAAGKLARMLVKSVNTLGPDAPVVIITQSDLVPGQLADDFGLDYDGWPLDREHERLPKNSYDVVLGRNLFYDPELTFGMIQFVALLLLKTGGTLAIASVRNQFITCVAVPIFAASSSGQLKDIIVTFSQLTPEKNQSAHNVVCMSAVKAQADKCPVDPPLERSVIEMVLAG